MVDLDWKKQDEEFDVMCPNCGGRINFIVNVPSENISDELLADKETLKTYKKFLMLKLKQIEDYEKLHG
jgi:hypothetical protein